MSLIKNCLVSVVMPSYNHESYISEAIESVLQQSFTDFEFIIVDDCSIDASIEIINDYNKKDKRIKVLFHEKNKGISTTINDGIEMVKGKYIALIASDDVWVHNKLEQQIAILEHNENLIVWSEGDIIDEKSRYTGKRFTELYCLNQKKSGNLFYELLNKNSTIIFGSSLIFKRNNLGNIKFNEQLKYDNDFLFYIELANKFNFYFIKESLTKYRIHGENTRERISLQKKEKYKDRVKLNLYLLEVFKNEIPKKIKWKIYSRLILALLELDRKKARITIYNTITQFPFKFFGYFFLMKSYIKSPLLSKIFFRIQKMLNISL